MSQASVGPVRESSCSRGGGGGASQLGTFPARDPMQAPGRPLTGWMTHRFLGIIGLRKCSRRHGALPLASQSLTGCWRGEKNALGPWALSESISRAGLQEPLAPTILHSPQPP